MLSTLKIENDRAERWISKQLERPISSFSGKDQIRYNEAIKVSSMNYLKLGNQLVSINQ